MNFGTGELAEDNVIEQWKNRNQKIYFFGDDTWIKLFPSHFYKSDGVSSFFVSDFIEVDQNVSRHLPYVLQQSKYDKMILHYLGLDHIGHTFGPKNPIMSRKLEEMDSVIEKIHQSLERLNKSYLFTICGDHGMASAGGHGGASYFEKTTPFVFCTHNARKILKYLPKGYSTDINQVDMASTLSLMSSSMIPKSNTGRPIKEVMLSVGNQLQVLALHYTAAKQLVNFALSSGSLTEKDDAVVLHKKALSEHEKVLRRLNMSSSAFAINKTDEVILNGITELYLHVEKTVANKFASQRHTYDMPVIVVSSLFLLLIAIKHYCASDGVRKESLSSHSLVVVGLALVLVWCAACGIYSDSGLCSATGSSLWLLLVPFCYVVYCTKFIPVLLAQFAMPYFEMMGDFSLPMKLLISYFAVFYPLSLGGSSFVEEEHYGHYFILSSIYFIFLCLAFYNKTSECSPVTSGSFVYLHMLARYERKFRQYRILRILSCMLLLRVLRCWNSTGDKWKHLSSISDWFKEPDNSLCRNTVFVMSLLCLGCLFFSRFWPIVAANLLCLLNVHFRVIKFDSHGLVDSRIGYLCLAGILSCAVYRIRQLKKDCELPHPRGFVVLEHLNVALSLLLVMLGRESNVPFFALALLHNCIFIPTVDEMVRAGLVEEEVAPLAVMLVTQALFFAQGNSNSLTTVDVRAGFVGMSTYHPGLHGFLISFHTFGLIFLTFLSYLLYQLWAYNDFSVLWRSIHIWWMVQLIITCFYSLNVIFQRYHLFIWSVFTPKLLYVGCQTIILFVVSLTIGLTEGIDHYSRD